MKKVFEVVFSQKEWVQHRQGWILRRKGGEPIASFETREQAVERGRQTCDENRPSKLRVAKMPS